MEQWAVSPEYGRSWQAAYPGVGDALFQLRVLLQSLEQSLHMDQLVHAWHVQALADPTLAADSRMARFGEESRRALWEKVAAMGLLRRYLGGAMSRELVQLLRRQTQRFLEQQVRAGEAFREVLADPEAAENPDVQGLRYWLSTSFRTTRAIAETARTALGVTVPAGVEPWELQ